MAYVIAILHLINGDTSFPFPAVLGHEVSGIVKKVASGAKGLKEGDRVACTVIMPCGSCYYCINGHEDLCEVFFKMNRLKGVLYDGTSRLHGQDGNPIWMFSMGGMAEYAIVPTTATFPLPDDLPLEESSILGCAGLTAYGAVKNQAQLRALESVAVIGAGGVGSSIIQIAKVFGAAEIIAVDVKDEKLRAVSNLGATSVINSSRDDPVNRILELTGGRGVDVAFESIGRPETYSVALNSVRSGGRVVAVGLSTSRTIIPLELNRFVRKGVKLLGSYGGSPRQDMPELLTLAKGGYLNLHKTVTKRYKLHEVNDALGALQRGEITGRSILVI